MGYFPCCDSALQNLPGANVCVAGAPQPRFARFG